jgi:hypothetical protein
MKRRSSVSDLLRSCTHCSGPLERTISDADINRVVPQISSLENTQFHSWDCVYSFVAQVLFQGNEDLPAAQAMREAISRYNGGRRPSYVSLIASIDPQCDDTMSESTTPCYALDYDPEEEMEE